MFLRILQKYFLDPTGSLDPAVAATYGYTVAFAVSAGLFGLGFILAVGLLPSGRRLADLNQHELSASMEASRLP